MAQKQLNFQSEINNSLQAGDTLYYTPPAVNRITVNPSPCGSVAAINNSNFSIEYNEGYGAQPNIGDYILFSKPIQVNESSIKGYYADVTFTNSSTKRVELFAVSSEITLSSK